ncbi:T7SS effector LXG polymorphic toxin [Bacillus changyiensis]|uniref:T7SS effector LXG polymorphic toxin n=1 Tax=Bacillus changyiensis TaxID=3004103 RepID=UPI0022E1B523|nr:T7SS effector LXG polymorphic toxin [Bacillus changyiensis]MDA1476426.1 T7SS effector LXG polymorphic toxin [Bacillus changyiensis]
MAKNKKNDKGKNNELDSSVKVFEASTLIERADQRKKDYKNLKEKLQTLKTACDGVADLGDDFTGKGADNIKEFFRGQSEVVDSWIALADMQISFFNGVAGDVKDKKLTDSYIEMSFLKTELKNADKSSDEIVLDLKNNMDRIIDRVNDIVDLDKWTDHNYTVEMSKAQTTRKNAIDAVDDLDKSLTGEYIRATAEAKSVSDKYKALLEATSNGKTASPMYFDKKAFHSNKLYKEAIKIDKQATEYIKAKKEQAKARELQAKQEAEMERLRKLQEEEENKPWYQKALEGTKTFVGEMSGYYDYKRAKDGVDPVTGEKLTAAERVAAAAMATAGFIPVVGWAGRAAKGGRAIYKTAKTFSAAEHALSAYKTTKGMQVLKMTEMGAYGLATSNGFSEALTGKDMFGQKVSAERQKQSLIDATLNMVGAKAAAGTRAVSGTTRAAVRSKDVVKPSQKMTHLIKAATKKYPLAKSPKAVIMKTAKKILDKVKRIKVPVKARLHAEEFVTTTGHRFKNYHMHVEKKTLGEIGHGIVKFARGKDSAKSVAADSSTVSGIKTFVDKGNQFTNGRRNRLKPNIRYKTGEYDYFYETDHLGRISKFETENLQLTEREKRLSHSRNTLGKIKGKDHAGHLAADRFGGSPKIDNLVSQLSDVNLTQYKKIENEWAAALNEIPPRKVEVNVKIKYDGDNTRPSEFIVEYEIDGIYDEATIIN